MNYLSSRFLCVVLLGLSLSACKNAETPGEETAPSIAKQKTTATTQFSDKPGLLGLIRVGEMLSISKVDSAPADGVSAKMKEDFDLLDRDFQEIGAEIGGPQGIIYYNHDPQSFKFECVVLIKSMPAKVPKHSNVVMLEADQMLVYNHYGSYESTFKAYEEIRHYCEEKMLEQIGPMREFYPASLPGADSTKRLTRIMVPVKQIGANP